MIGWKNRKNLRESACEDTEPLRNIRFNSAVFPHSFQKTVHTDWCAVFRWETNTILLHVVRFYTLYYETA